MKKLIHYLALALVIIAGLVLVLMVVHVTLDVLGKYFFNAPLPGTAEIVASYYMIAAVFLPLAYIEVVNRPIMVEILYERLGPRLRWLCWIIATICSILFYFFLARESWYIAMNSMAIREIVEGTWKVVIWPSRFLIPIGLFVACLALFLRLLLLLTQGQAALEQDTNEQINEMWS